MKMQNRLLALLLTALMVWTLAIPAMGANPFFDVPEDHWAYDAVEYLAEAGLVEGYPDGTFSGSRNFTRYEMALVFARIVARFEQRVDNLIAQGIDSRLEDLSAQVATAMKDAAEALRAASEATQVQVIEPEPSIDPELLAEALAAAKQAQATAEQAVEVAVGTLQVIDARGWEQQIEDAEAQGAAAAALAQQALAAAEKAVSEAATALEVAVGTLEAIDAQGWGDQIDGAMSEAQAATAEAKAASALAAEALAAAEKALLSAENAMNAANNAMEIAVGTLEVIDERKYDERIDNAAGSADQALLLAQQALSGAEEAIAMAHGAMEVAIGTLEVIDARDWEGRIAGATAEAQGASSEAQAATAEAKAASALAAQALAAAEKALRSAENAMEAANGAMDVAVGTLWVIDERKYDERIDNAAGSADQALVLAQQALASAEEAVATAHGAMEVAIGTLEVIDAREWEARLTEAQAKADEALALARSIAATPDEPEAPTFTAEARAVIEEIAAAIVMDRLVEVKENADAIAAQVRDLRTDVDAAQALIRSEANRLEKAIMDLTHEFATELEIVGVRVAALEAKFTALDTRVASLETDVSNLGTSVSTLESSVSGLESNVATLGTSVSGLESNVATLGTSVSGLESNVVSLGTSVSGLESNVATLGSSVSTLESDVSALGSKLSALGTSVSGLESNVATLGSSVSTLESDVSALGSKLSALGTNVSVLETNVATLGTSVATLESDLSLLGTNVSALESDLATLGTSVSGLESNIATLETTVGEHGREIQSLREDVDRYKISGFNEAMAFVGTSEGVGPFRNDPRDPNSGTFNPETGAANRLHVRLDGKPNDEVDLVALVDLVVDSRNPLTAGGILKNSEAYVEATSDRPVRVVRLGYLDANRVAQGFSSQLLHAGEFDKTSNVGAFTNIVSATTDSDFFVAYVLQDKKVVAGASTDIDLGGMDVTVGAVRLFDNSQPRTGLSVAASGGSDTLTYDGLIIADVEQGLNLYKGSLEVPIQSANFTATIQRIPALWSQAANRLPFAAEVKPYDAAKADKVVDVNNDILAGQSLIKGRVDMPIGSFQAYAQLGRYRAGSTVDIFNQIGVYDLNLLGFDTSITRSTFVDQANGVLTDHRASFATSLDDIDLKFEVNRAVDGQVAPGDIDADRNQFMVSVAKPVNILLPWEGSVTFGVNLSDAPVADTMHSSYKLALTDYPVLSDVTLGAEISAVNNVITDGRWRLNSNWTGEDETKRAINAKWRFAEVFNLTGGYSIVNNTATGTKITQDAGVEYVMSGAFGGDLTLGYGYRLVRDGAGVVDGTARNVVSAAFNRTAGGFTLNADAKRYMGGTSGEAGNDVDTVATLQLTYPVFKGADLTVDGKYVSSEGTKAAEYQAGSLSAGLRFNF